MLSISKILIAKALLVFCANLSISDNANFHFFNDNLVEVPVIDVNFYMMNRSEAEVSTLVQLRENMAYLNEEFEDAIKFEVKNFFVNEGYALLPDLHQEYFSVEELTIDSLVRDIETEGAINVYIFDSYVIEEMNAELMGFTPIFRAGHSEYENASPGFDRIFLAYSALEKKTTLVHEMGHFLGLDHPWEMSQINQHLMGLEDEASIEKNHMAYGHKVEGFTREQLERMQHFALQFRSYLVSRKEYFLKDHLANL